VVDQGRNFFRVEASATGDIAKLRPGMEGVGKIDVDRRKLLWIWTHKLDALDAHVGLVLVAVRPGDER
jgi:hypothetical protein